MRSAAIFASLVIPILTLTPGAFAQAGPVRVSGSPGPVSLPRLDVRVDIDGLIAHTTLTVTLKNEGANQSEGVLQFETPPGATVQEYALDVNGHMVDGVAVERERARMSYVAEMTRRVDPGLVEHVAGNTFCAHVYPIAGGSQRTFRLGYVSELTMSEGRAVYSVPLNWGCHAGSAKVTVTIASASRNPEVSGSVFKTLAFAQGKKGFSAEQTFDGLALDGNLAITTNACESGVQIGKGPALGAPNAPPDAGVGHYFVVHDVPQLAAPPAAENLPKPHHVGIWWDGGFRQDGPSLSRKIAILKKIMAQWGDVDVDLAIFREHAEKPATFLVRDGNCGAIEKILGALAYDGASRLSELSFPRHPRDVIPPTKIGGDDFDLWLLFSDAFTGITPAGPGTPQTPLYVIGNPGANAIHPLESTAIASGGGCIDLARMTDEQAIDALRVGQPELISVEFNPMEIADVAPTAVRVTGGVVSVTGRLLAPQANLTLHYRWGTHTCDRTVTLRQTDAKSSSYAAQVWLNRRLAELLARPAPDYEQCLRLGRFFNVVTPVSSLLVLETVDQYVRHEVMPPATSPELRAGYLQQVRLVDIASNAEDKRRQTELAAAWNQRMDWYHQIYPYPANFRYVAHKVPDFTDAPDLGLSSTASKRTDSQGGGGALFSGGEGGGGGGLFSGGGNRNVDRTNAAPAAPAVVNVHLADAAAANIRVVQGVAPLKADPWHRDPSYVEAMRGVPRNSAYRVYLQKRTTFGGTVAFYLDCSDYLIRFSDRAAGIRVLTDAVALLPDDPQVLRMVARRLERLGDSQMAIELFDRVLAMSPDDPQAYRDLALAWAAAGDRAAARATQSSQAPALAAYRRALDLLRSVALRTWTRSPGIQVVALTEYGGILARAQLLDPKLRPSLEGKFDSIIDMDLRIVLTWDTDASMVLSITEPSGEPVYPAIPTTIGGMLNTQCSDGYGPHEYCLRRLLRGHYIVRATDIVPSRRLGPTTVQATIITDFGRPSEKRRVLSVILNDRRDSMVIGSVMLDQDSKSR